MSWVGMSCLLFDHRFFSSVQEAGSREDGACEQMCWSTLQAGDGGVGGWGWGRAWMLPSLRPDGQAQEHNSLAGRDCCGIQRTEIAE